MYVFRLQCFLRAKWLINVDYVYTFNRFISVLKDTSFGNIKYKFTTYVSHDITVVLIQQIHSSELNWQKQNSQFYVSALALKDSYCTDANVKK